MKVCHLTSVHARGDTRIFLKECKSLSKSGYDVSLIVADGLGDAIVEGVAIYDVGKTMGGRLSRVAKKTKEVYLKALELDADIYHFHDPELILYAYMLKRKGKKVIYDTHEDLPRQIMSKPYLHPFSKKIISVLAEFVENFFAARFDLIITATPFIRDRFLKINRNTIDVNNYPILTELIQSSTYSSNNKEVCYVGGLSRVRGLKEIVHALEILGNVKLNLAGSFSELEFEKEMRSEEGWKYVNELGFLNREEVKKVLSNSRLGLVTLHPIINYQDALPVKMFEYMAAGIPVVSSNIQLWKKIITENSCGICVNPFSSSEVASAIKYLLENPIEARKMGENGKKAVIEKFNWKLEEDKLINQYQTL